MSEKTIQDATGLVLSCLPPHAGELSITHNQHKSAYETVDEHLTNCFGSKFYVEWASEDERTLAITTNELWIMQWYPQTPIGFCAIAAASLGALLAHAAKLGKV